MRRLIRGVSRKAGSADGARAEPPAADPAPSEAGARVLSIGAAAFHAGLDVVANPVLLVRQPGLRVVYANPAAEATFGVSRKGMVELTLPDLFGKSDELHNMLDTVVTRQFDVRRQDLILHPPLQDPIHVHVVIAALEAVSDTVVVEILPNEQKVRSDREERILDLTSANKELIRNLAHEIKNPLGGIRGAAQLLEFELPERSLREYTQVIIKESDRLQTLVDRLLEPHRHPHIVSSLNIHEVLERVRSVVLAEFPNGLEIVRDYDASLPELRGDMEQLIQAVLNIVHNAAQALADRIARGDAQIVLRTRIARQVTIAKRLFKLALDLHVIDNGPGIPEDIRERIFYPLVSGRDGGSGLGLTLAQTFVQQHEGLIECESRPGCTDFRILLPLH
ncbi:nitrogen regulation protein NR(II) [Cupriavidus taiwanensis]|uniref:Sensory histidine kinase/phosphatase NtrB n=1 Tax=Cupriavidus taiwanensis TaxID=164546 RepID=A0A7Z7J8A1_9BURK|nr:nitrogen regulation protein NR(II) [Cupriavidus taiwanensis]SOY88061.1 Nitrogen regulation protein NR(II) [Cupriavidus taiwanensis]SOZ05720.1 Nitrogen regulation protein NR(II) [Cupriavidus taiwanensis]SOZ07703.1 Nitrogen regulation protein NR(II) [Cupriavidus taiwanensis]SPC15740.1 Nitrogen regulation protein NR(II) [Cupriavidus taiwanensis]SPD40399.1 sensory histidine kinase in two-component regulatory system with GlnG [Cupriavidus taiwanensis]